jgi:hypothetical protein
MRAGSFIGFTVGRILSGFKFQVSGGRRQAAGGRKIMALLQLTEKNQTQRRTKGEAAPISQDFPL